MNEEIRNLISEAKNICLIPSENEPESLTSCLALFYTLRELGKNVNLISDNLPEKLNFLLPSVDLITPPKNFVISIPRSAADISQIYYEKTDENLKSHLTTDKGNIKKENISFYFQDAKPDLVITLGIQDFRKQLENKLDSFGFLLGSPILNIDNDLRNSSFGQINSIEQKSLSEIVLSLIKSINENPDSKTIGSPWQNRDLINKSTANCLLCGLVIYYENFKSKNMSEEVFRVAAELIKRGANNQQIVDNLYKSTEKEINFLGKILHNIKRDENLSFAVLSSMDLENFSDTKASFVVEKIKNLGIQDDLLVLGESHASEPAVKGFFYSKKPALVNRVAETFLGINRNEWVFLLVPKENINSVKEKILSQLNNFN